MWQRRDTEGDQSQGALEGTDILQNLHPSTFSQRFHWSFGPNIYKLKSSSFLCLARPLVAGWMFALKPSGLYFSKLTTQSRWNEFWRQQDEELLTSVQTAEWNRTTFLSVATKNVSIAGGEMSEMDVQVSSRWDKRLQEDPTWSSQRGRGQRSTNSADKHLHLKIYGGRSSGFLPMNSTHLERFLSLCQMFPVLICSCLINRKGRKASRKPK